MRRNLPHDTAPGCPSVESDRGNVPAVNADLLRLRRKLLGLARRDMRNADAAEDVTQEAMLALLLSPERHRTGALRDCYAVGVLKHKIADHFRDRQRETPMDPATLEALCERGSVSKTPGARHDGPERIDAKRDSARFWRALRVCLDSLPETTRSAFVLRDLQEWEMAAVSRHLGVRPTHVSVMTHRARAHVRDRWPTAVQALAVA